MAGPRDPRESPPVPDQADRVQRLEEAAMFADHRTEALDQAVKTLDGIVQRLSQRIDRLEARLAVMQRVSEASSPSNEAGEGVE